MAIVAPTDIAGLTAWHSADGAGHVTDVNGYCTSIPNLIAGGARPLNSAFTKGPLLVPNGQNGKPVYRLVANTHIRQNTSNSLASIFVALKNADTPAKFTADRVAVHYGSPLVRGILDTKTVGIWTGNVRINNVAGVTLSDAQMAGDWFVLSGFAGSAINLGELGLGYNGASWIGDVGELLVYNVDMTEAQKKDVYDYLAARWLGSSGGASGGSGRRASKRSRTQRRR